MFVGDSPNAPDPRGAAVAWGSFSDVIQQDWLGGAGHSHRAWEIVGWLEGKSAGNKGFPMASPINIEGFSVN